MKKEEADKYQQNISLAPDVVELDQALVRLQSNWGIVESGSGVPIPNMVEDIALIDRMGRAVVSKPERPLPFERTLIVFGREGLVKQEVDRLLEDAKNRGDHEAVIKYIRVAHLMGYSKDPAVATMFDQTYQYSVAELTRAAQAPPTPNVAPNPNRQRSPKHTEWDKSQLDVEAEWQSVTAGLTPDELTLDEKGFVLNRLGLAMDIVQKEILSPNYNQELLRAKLEALIPKVWIDDNIFEMFFKFKPRLCSATMTGRYFYLLRPYRMQPTFTRDQKSEARTIWGRFVKSCHPDPGYEGPDPQLRDRMTIFFHGIDTTWKSINKDLLSAPGPTTP